MKITKFLSLLFLVTLFFSCEEDEIGTPELAEPTFTATVSADDPGVYIFENTTPNKEDFYSFFEFEDGDKVAAHNPEAVTYTYDSNGVKIITLTMLGNDGYLQTTQAITVTLPPPADDRFLLNPENLITNGYFADGTGNDFTGWNRNNGADNMTESTDGNISVRAMQVSNGAAGNEWDTQLISSAVPTTNGTEYTISVWMKGDDANVIRFSTNPGSGGTEQYGPNFTATAGWEQHSWTITANSSTTTVALDMGKSQGVFVIDGVEMVEGANALTFPSNDSELLNGSFENGSGDDFDNWNKNNGADRLTEEATDVLSGSRALKVSNPADGNQWDTQFVSDGFTTVNGDVYTVSLWIKGTADIRYSTNPGSGGTEQYAGDYVATSSWSQYSWTFTANSATTSIALDMGKIQGDFIIDHVKVTKN
jgi:hypothetical protein